ncbi:MAG: hypothetical protein BAA04_12725 [Firmicutes bacterium ZCTH02-B6]|nr:MAG: hypothetical protein BAA04_12725 [Firmicutes bacterium ZCTH02-B6]
MALPRPLLEELDTPALVVDLAVMERNIERMAGLARQTGVGLRPHAKTHKSPWIAHQQLRAGAIGITVAKLGEAEAMVEAGIRDILLAYPILGEQKLSRLERLLNEADIILSVDSLEAAEAMAQAVRRSGRGRARVFIDVDTGLRRMGLGPGMPTVELAERIARIQGLEVAGLMSHAGHVAAARTPEELAATARRAAEALVETAEILRRRGLPIAHVSPGSTPAACFEAQVSGVTEIRPGTYVFNDRNTMDRWAAGEADCALTVLATVVSRPAPDRAVIDAGSKVFSSDPSVRGDGTFGHVVGWPGVRLQRLSEEHGVLVFDPDHNGVQLRVGDRLHIIPNHVCPAVNLSDVLYGYRDGRVVREIPVMARGKYR